MRKSSLLWRFPAILFPGTKAMGIHILVYGQNSQGSPPLLLSPSSSSHHAALRRLLADAKLPRLRRLAPRPNTTRAPPNQFKRSTPPFLPSADSPPLPTGVHSNSASPFVHRLRGRSTSAAATWTRRPCRPALRAALSSSSPLLPVFVAAAVQLSGCFLRYDNESFIGKEETNLLYKKCGATNGYDPNLIGMRDDALSAIASSGGTGGTYRVSASGYVQAAAQCVGDLSAKDCSDCISTAINQLKSVCGDAVSGEVYLGKCFAKYYTGGAFASSTSTSTPSSSGYYDHRDESTEEAGKTLAIILGLIAGVALIIVFASFIRRAGSNKL
ncbi:uncharacterized protein A4U43_C06F5430 [Asparagus officinalis]|uniref:Gnk2-homologous domain-containing protein n=1 Tax=Asparagus officinalis TaxID=4686 RepID=A0A5P1EK00_ASPOF|nr:uncharacterized protein A4U43_C06F5430 [Asparagus officinalis]